ncbi:MAG: putative tryptophan/tyrosine transport system substrate-binding protein [Candidatus Dependentiae bacterium]|nr:putative tryptophan/tyrosine transport system substrate-binding protein [Candidatus Dependentiae bacterium]
MSQLSRGVRIGITVAFGTSLTLVVLCHTSLLNYCIQQRERWLAAPVAHRISFHLAADVPALQELMTAAVDFCKAQGVNLEVKKFYHHQDLSLLKGQIEESIAWESKAIITIGNVSAQNAHTLLTKRDCPIPHIFTCVSDPVALGISQEKDRTGTHSTGIAEDASGASETCIRSLLHIRPDAKRVLIFHSTTSPMLKNIATDMIKNLATQKIEAGGIAITKLDEISKFSQAYITRDIDIVVLLRDSLVVSGLQTIVKICRMHGVTCITSDSYSVRNGAAAACCVEEAEIGLLVAELILKIVDQGIAPEALPVTYFNTADLCRICINPYEMGKQGLHNRGIYNLMKSPIKLEFIHQ